MQTETVDVTNLNDDDKVKLFGSVYEVVGSQKTWANERRIDLREVDGDNKISLSLEFGVAFERVVSDSEEFRARSTTMPAEFWADFKSYRHNPTEVLITAYKYGEPATSFSVDKADLKAVVEKL